MTLCRWLTPLQNSAWANNWHRKNEYHQLRPEYISKTANLNRRVGEQDKRTVQAKRSKFLQRATSAKMAAREAFLQQQNVDKPDSPTLIGNPMKRELGGRLLGIVQPAGYCIKSNDNSNNSRNSRERQQKQVTQTKMTPRKTTSMQALHLVSPLSNQLINQTEGTKLDMQAESNRPEKQSVIPQHDASRLIQGSDTNQRWQGGSNSSRVGVASSFVNSSTDSRPGNVARSLSPSARPRRNNSNSTQQSQHQTSMPSIPCEDDDIQQRLPQRQPQSQFAPNIGQPRRAANMQFAKSKFAMAKVQAGINQQDFESFGSDKSQETSVNVELRLELDRFYQAQAVIHNPISTSHSSNRSLQDNEEMKADCAECESIWSEEDDDNCNNLHSRFSHLKVEAIPSHKAKFESYFAKNKSSTNKQHMIPQTPNDSRRSQLFSIRSVPALLSYQKGIQRSNIQENEIPNQNIMIPVSLQNLKV